MGFFDDICNREWCEELECACGTNIVLFTADGFTFFGLLDRFDDGIVTLVPAGGERNVIIVSPGGDILKEDLSFIDICTIVALSKNVTENPFESFVKCATTV
jgi:hypothetical protein